MSQSPGIVQWAKSSFSPDSITYRALRYLYQRRYVVSSHIHRNKQIDAYFSANTCRKICLGAGPSKLSGWLVTDYVPIDASVVFLDARRDFPFPDNSVDYYFTEHMIEHINYTEGRHAFEEMYRTLKPGGRIRIATPDLQKILALNTASITPGSVEGRYITLARPASVQISQDRASFAINSLISGHGHRFVYDVETLHDSLQQAGFTDIHVCDVGKSDDPIFANLESHWQIIGREFNELETMVIEACKPASKSSGERNGRARGTFNV